MSGYKREVWMRTVPLDGAEEWFDIGTLLTDAGGPTVARVRYREVRDQRENVNRGLRSIFYGVRPEVQLKFDVATMADHATLATITSRLMRDDWTVYLSLDGRLTEREVELVQVPEPMPFNGKTIGGASFTMDLRCRELLDDLPAMMADPETVRDFLFDGAMESWASATALNEYTSVLTGSNSVNREGTEQRSGIYGCRIDRNEAGNASIYQTITAGMQPGYWYEAGVYAKGDVAITDGLGIRILNNAQSESVGADAKTWAAASYAHDQDVTDEYALYTLRFRVDPDFADTDTYNIIFRHDGAVGTSLYLDDAYIRGPVLPPGVSTW